MIIQADQEGQKAIAELVDVALKAGGLQALSRVQQLLTSIKPIPVPTGDTPSNPELKTVKK